jgi:hypothetical protein
VAFGRPVAWRNCWRGCGGREPLTFPAFERAPLLCTVAWRLRGRGHSWPFISLRSDLPIGIMAALTRIRSDSTSKGREGSCGAGTHHAATSSISVGSSSPLPVLLSAWTPATCEGAAECRPSRYQAVGALPKPSSRRAVAIRGPILFIVPPCFGQTGVKCGARTSLIYRKSAGRLCGDIGLSTEHQCIPRRTRNTPMIRTMSLW